MNLAIAIAVSYLLGSIPFGLIVGKLAKGIDIRDFGSGNIGASNVLRTLGPVLFAVVLVLDVGKGFASVRIAEALGFGSSPWLVVLIGLTSVLGHTFSVFLKFRGGKAVATSLGVVIGLAPLIAAVAFGIWVMVVALTRYISLSSLIASVSVPTMMFAWTSQNVPLAYRAFAAVAALTIVIRHRSNMKRLITGTETKISEKVDIDAKPEAGDGQ